MPKDRQMQRTAPERRTPTASPLLPWSLRAWPPVLWQARRSEGLEFHHLGTRVMLARDGHVGHTGQTLWGGTSADGHAGVAWDWIQIACGVVAMADPMSVITNLRLLGDEGEVLTAFEAARFLNEIVHALPWQTEVARALGEPAQ